MPIRAIFYDLDGTLRLNVPSGWHVSTSIASELGLEISQVDRQRAARWEHYYFAESPELHLDEVAFTDRPAFWTQFCFRQLQVLGASSQQAAELAPVLTQRMAEAYHPVDVIPDDLFETLKTLKHLGYTLGILSNRKVSYADYLVEKGLSEYFDVVVFAGEAGILKPDPGIFLYLLEKVEVSAGESVYVGDNYYADVVGSREAGMIPILYDTQGLFTEPGCPVIQAHSQLLPLLEPKMPLYMTL